MLNDYQKISQIGKGSFSVVFKALNNKTNEYVAIKVISVEFMNNFSERLTDELNIIKKLDNENILKFKEIYKSKNNIYIISEICDYSLSKIILDHLSEKEIYDIFKQIINGMKYLYSKNILHRDIKPDNILIKNGIIKIADFGFAKEADKKNTLMETLCGSPLYMSPELIMNKSYDFKSDIWSLGIVLYQLMYKKHPFGNVKNIVNLLNNFNTVTKIQYDETYSKELIDLVSNMLIKNPLHRISWENIFSHIWLNKKDVEIDLQESLKNSGYLENEENDLFNSLSKSNNSKNDNSHIENSTNNSDIVKSKKDINDHKSIFDNFKKSEPIPINKITSFSHVEKKINHFKIGEKDVPINEDYFNSSVETIDNNSINIKNNVSQFNPFTIVKKTWRYFSL